MASTTTHAAFAALTLIAAGLTAGCTSSDSTADVAPTASTEASAGAVDSQTLAPVGPLLLGSPAYWNVLDTVDGTTLVQARGCAAESQCPSFAVLQGDSLVGDVDPTAAFTQDPTGCPSGLAPAATESDPTLTDVVIDGVDGTLAEFWVDCVDDGGTAELTVSQLQWYLPDAPGGPVLIVDRWAFDGLREAVAGAMWASTGS